MDIYKFAFLQDIWVTGMRGKGKKRLTQREEKTRLLRN